LIGFIRRNLGLDTHSIELRRIRRILEDHSSKNILPRPVCAFW
jgi:hypothetical protein